MESLIARRDFGPIAARGCVPPQDRSVTAYLDRAAALRASQAEAQA
jgi:hypothetical protein